MNNRKIRATVTVTAEPLYDSWTKLNLFIGASLTLRIRQYQLTPWKSSRRFTLGGYTKYINHPNSIGSKQEKYSQRNPNDEMEHILIVYIYDEWINSTLFYTASSSGRFNYNSQNIADYVSKKRFDDVNDKINSVIEQLKKQFVKVDYIESKADFTPRSFKWAYPPL